MRFRRSIYLTIFIFMFTAFLNFVPASAAKKAGSVPKLQIVTQPQREYRNGETISFAVTSPNYGGSVQYRVILYNGTTKKTTDLWNNPSTGNYYTGWQPSGSYCFEIHWPVSQMEPGAYSMTVLVRRAGSKVSYDSYVDTNSFWVIPKSTGNNTPTKVTVKDITLSNGSEYSGETVNGVPEGAGTAIYTNGDKYEGMWKNGLRDGYGTYIWAIGDKYVGYFKNDKQNGKGTFTYANGQSQEEEWRDGVKVTASNITVAPPVIIKIEIEANDLVKISWNGDNSDYYKIYYSSSQNGIYQGLPNNDMNQENKYTGNWARVTITNPGKAWLYYFKVTAVKNGVESKDSNIVFANYTGNMEKDPNTPKGLWAKALSSSLITITWNGIEGADYYKIYYSDSIDGVYKDLPNYIHNNYNMYPDPNHSDIQITLSNPPNSWVIYLKVSTVKNGVESDPSEPVRVSYP